MAADIVTLCESHARGYLCNIPYSSQVYSQKRKLNALQPFQKVKGYGK